MRFLGLLFCFAAIIVAITMGGPLASFFDVASAVLVFGVGLGAVFFGHGGSGLALIFEAAFGVVEREDAVEAHAATCSARRAFLGAGWIGLLIGSVLMLQNMADPSAIGPAVAVAILSLLYGYTTSALIWSPAEQRMAVLLHHPADAAQPSPQDESSSSDQA